MDRADGIYFWDRSGKRYTDFFSHLVNVNIGHGDQRVIRAIQDQAAALPFAHPGMATEVKARTGKLVAEITPPELKKTFFTLGGADAIENAIKVAKLYTGRSKIISRYRSYHGATMGAMTVSGDPRRLPVEPGIPGVIHVHDPYCYRCLFCGEPGSCNLMCADHVDLVVQFEGPENIAAIVLEGVSGSSGIIYPQNPGYWQRIRAICDRYGILLVVDEVMSGFGRTGRWFGIDHYGVKVDIMAIAKGITSGYAPLGGTVVSEDIGDHFDTSMLWAGMTYSGHPLSLAAAEACINVYKEDRLIENARLRGRYLDRRLDELQEAHPSIGETRGLGLFHVIELVKNRETREPMSGWNQPLSEPMVRIRAYLREHGLFTSVRWNWIFCAPPLVITDEQIDEALEVVDGALSIADGATG